MSQLDLFQKPNTLQSRMTIALTAALQPEIQAPEYVHTWKAWVMPSGPGIFALRARARRTSDSAFTGSLPLTPEVAQIILSGGEPCLISAEDLDFLSQWKWRKHKKGYAYRSTRSGNVYMHRLILGLEKGEGIADHISRDKLDNRRENLRAVTQSESNHNRPTSNDGVTKPKGRTRWTVCLWIDKRFQWLGSFATKEEAISARVEALLQAGLVTPQTPMTGWPTPDAQAMNVGCDPAKHMERLARLKEVHGNGNGAGLTLGAAAALAGWCTPTAQDHSRGSEGPRPHDTGVPLSQQAALAGWHTPDTKPDRPWGQSNCRNVAAGLGNQAALAGWNTPRATDGSNGGPHQAGGALPADAALAGWCTPTCGSPNSLRGTGQDPEKRKAGGHSVNLQDQVRLASGTPSTSSPAAMGKRGALNPAFSLWLMGFPSCWLMAAPSKKPRASRSSEAAGTR